MMPKESRLAATLITALVLSLPTVLPAQDATLAIVGGRLIDGYGGPPIHDSVVLITGNRITAVGTQDSIDIPDGVPQIDADGRTVMPGLIDLHVHFDIIGHGDYDHWFSTYESRMRPPVPGITI